MDTSKQQKQIEKYIKMQKEKLYETLGCEYNSNKSSAHIGKMVFRELDESLFQKICIEMEYCKNKSRYDYMDKTTLVRVLLASINKLELNGRPVPIEIIVAILIKTGLGRFCKC